MFTTPYMRKITDKIERICSGHETDFFWPATEETRAMLDTLHGEYHKCASDPVYSGKHFTNVPADAVEVLPGRIYA